MIFSIRRKDKNNKNYYQIYESQSKDLINFYNTEKIEITGFNDSKWFCYPNVFTLNDKKYVFLNQDDFGKNKNLLLGEIL